jgi:hypothetical protein
VPVASKFVRVDGNNHTEEVSFDGSVENLDLFDLSLTLGRPTPYSLVLLCDACIRRSYPQTVLLFKMILIKMIPFIFSKDT